MKPTETIDPKTLKIVSREEWGASEAKKIDLALKHPVKYVILSSTRTEPCESQEHCKRVIRNLQKHHIDNGLPDVMHNFMIGGDGTIYEGRGWKIRGIKFADDEEEHLNAIDIAFIGPYRDPERLPSQKLINIAYALISYGIMLKYVKKRFYRSDLDYM